MDRMEEVTDPIETKSHRSVSDRIHPVDPVHPVVRLLWLRRWVRCEIFALDDLRCSMLLEEEFVEQRVDAQQAVA